MSIAAIAWVARTLHSNGELVADKFGLVLVVLGGMHFFNLCIFSPAEGARQSRTAAASSA